MRFLLMALFLLVSFSFSEELQKETFEFFSLEKSKSMHDYRTKLFADFFGNDLLDFGREGTYLFYECFGVQRLFYWGHGVDKEIIVYQLPRINLVPWLHPEEYEKDRKKSIEKSEIKESCFSKTVPQKEMFEKLDSMQLDSRLYSNPVTWAEKTKEKENFAEDMNFLILGFSNKLDKKEYFYFRKNSWFEHVEMDVLKFYSLVFDVVKSIDETIDLSGCK